MFKTLVKTKKTRRTPVDPRRFRISHPSMSLHALSNCRSWELQSLSHKDTTYPIPRVDSKFPKMNTSPKNGREMWVPLLEYIITFMSLMTKHDTEHRWMNHHSTLSSSSFSIHNTSTHFPSNLPWFMNTPTSRKPILRYNANPAELKGNVARTNL